MSKHRLDALVDGIFAVAMTLLVIELKLPEDFHAVRSLQLLQALANLIPRFIGWVISFFVLAMFWWGQTRALQFAKRVDGSFTALNLLLLACASFLPFASAVSGQFPLLLGSQIVYSTVMFMLAVAALLVWRYLHAHPELCEPPMPAGVYRESQFRTITLMVISVAAVLLATRFPGSGNAAFMLMMPAGAIGRAIQLRAEKRARRVE